MAKIVRMTESDLTTLVKRILKEQYAGESKRFVNESSQDTSCLKEFKLMKGGSEGPIEQQNKYIGKFNGKDIEVYSSGKARFINDNEYKNVVFSWSCKNGKLVLMKNPSEKTLN